MALLSKTITAIGGLLLAHACYSAREHTTLQSLQAPSSSLTSSSTSISSLPLDIVVETIVSTFIILVGLVLGTHPLRPVEWRVWAGKIEREGEEGFTNNSGTVDEDYMGNPFSVLESRPNFVDIRKLRREFSDWAQQEEVKQEGGK